MTNSLINVLLIILKWIVESKSKKKLNNEQFIAHIIAYNKRYKGISDSAIDAEASLKEIIEELKSYPK